MQFIPVFLFAIISSYSLVLAAPVNQSKRGNNLSFRLICNSCSFVLADADSLQAKQQKATEIAGRLLKQMAAEQSATHHQQEVKVLDGDEPAKDDSSEEQAETDFLAYPTMTEIREYLQNQHRSMVGDLDGISEDHYEPLIEFDDEPSSETEEDEEELFPVPYQFFEHNWAEEDDESTSRLSPSLK